MIIFNKLQFLIIFFNIAIFLFNHHRSSRPNLPLSLPKLPVRPCTAVPQELPDKARYVYLLNIQVFNVVKMHVNKLYCRDKLRMCQSMQSTGKLQLSPNVVYDFTSEDLQDLGEIGRGGFGTVNKMIHRISDTVMAVKVYII